MRGARSWTGGAGLGFRGRIALDLRLESQGVRFAKGYIAFRAYGSDWHNANKANDFIGENQLGWVAERFIAPVLKTGDVERRPWVRIPPHPLI